MSKILSLILLALISFNLHAAKLIKPPFTACKSTYALCTTGVCKPAPGKEGSVVCDCEVKTGYSAGTKACTGIVKTAHAQTITSRYYPVKSYVTCNNDRPWAFCLDSPCVIDSKDPKKAACVCSLVQNKDAYVIVTDHYSASTCSTDTWSSATVDDISQITDFLRGNSDLKPFDMKVLNK